ncbi:ABC transporter permease [Fusobacterium nucleatum]|uniref:ABC transporter permease n=1 Tax=Fusobacterium animalis TaxID=76859 RepID=UPI0030AB3939
MTKKLIFINIFLVIILLIFSSKLNADINLDSVFLGFSKENFFGTDDLGRDVFSLIIIGGFRTLEVVVIATSLSFFVGSFLGMIAGYFEGNIGTIIKSTVDLMMVVPTLIVALIITSIFGITPITAGISLGIFGIGNYMNQSEALTKAEKNKDYILASKLLGVPWYVVLFRRIFVNVLARLLVNLGNTASGVILQYSALTFIGLGSDYTKPDWGAMLYQYRIYLVRKPSLIIIPTLCILWVSLSFNLIFDNREN